MTGGFSDKGSHVIERKTIILLKKGEKESHHTIG